MSEKVLEKYNKQALDWRTRLKIKSPSTSAMYKTYITQFLEKAGPDDNFTQGNIDEYFADLENADKKQAKKHQESTATKQLRRAALKFYLNDCLKLDINFKDYSIKG